MSFSDLLRIAPGTRPDLAAIDPRGTPGFEGDKETAQARVDGLRDELAEFQERLWAEAGQSLLVVLQALDGGGKDGLIRKVITAFNPQGTRVTGFVVPTEEELRHDFLWRVHAVTPGKGRIGVFNRSHYEDVLVVRVKELVPESVWQDRYRQINDFEAMLAANSTRIVKFYLHISRDEQRERFLKRLQDPKKGWKWDPADLETREKWADYQAAYMDALELCSTDSAPWFVIPADHKWYRDLAVAEILAETARSMDPRWPEAQGGPERGRRPGLSLAQPVLTRQARAKSRIASIALGPASVVTDRSIFGSSATSRQISWMSFVSSSSCASVWRRSPRTDAHRWSCPRRVQGPSGAPAGP